jgi:hypothetical protein
MGLWSMHKNQFGILNYNDFFLEHIEVLDYVYLYGLCGCVSCGPWASCVVLP